MTLKQEFEKVKRQTMMLHEENQQQEETKGNANTGETNKAKGSERREALAKKNPPVRRY